MSVLHVLYENEAWLPPLTSALAQRGIPTELHFVDGAVLDLGEALPRGVFLNRMSPSSHTRGHQAGVVATRELLGLLEVEGRRVINGSRAFALEVSKLQQDAALRAEGILTPRTLGVIARDAKAASRRFDGPFITKHNQGGKGLGVQLFRSHQAFDAFVDQGGLQDGSPDGVVILQQYIPPAEPFITRVEIVDDEFLYAIRSSTEQGFELCPAEACAVGDSFCPVGVDAPADRFRLATDLGPNDPLVIAYRRLMRNNRLDVAGIEFVTDVEGRRWTYDINGTTNYNATVEAAHGLHGMGAIAALAERYLRRAAA